MFRLRIILAAFAIISLASMPFGYMPDRGADGGFVLRICGGTMPMVHKSGHEASAAGMDHADHAKKDRPASDGHEGDEHEVRCNYAVPGLAAMPAVALVEDRIALPLADEPLARHPLTGLFPPHLPPSTGPPSA